MTTTPVTLDALTELIRARRTSLLIDPDRAVDDRLIERLCELVTWAPNHKRTWPWRFAVFTGEGRVRLGDAFADDLVDEAIGDEIKVAKTRLKYLRAPVVIVIGCDPHDHPTFHDENRDAVAAGIQNLLLGATAAGLASFWSTAPTISGAGAARLCGFGSESRIIGVVYLGWPTAHAPIPPRPPVSITRCD